MSSVSPALQRPHMYTYILCYVGTTRSSAYRTISPWIFACFFTLLSSAYWYIKHVLKVYELAGVSRALYAAAGVVSFDIVYFILRCLPTRSLLTPTSKSPRNHHCVLTLVIIFCLSGSSPSSPFTIVSKPSSLQNCMRTWNAFRSTYNASKL